MIRAMHGDSLFLCSLKQFGRYELCLWALSNLRLPIEFKVRSTHPEQMACLTVHISNGASSEDVFAVVSGMRGTVSSYVKF